MQIRKELGKDAVILNSKVIKPKGLLGLFKKSSIEVIAATDPDPQQARMPKNDTFKGSNKGKVDQPFMKERKKVEALPADQTILDELKKLTTVIATQQSSGGNQKHYPDALQKIYDFLLNQEIEPLFVNQIMEEVLEKFYERKKQVNQKELLEWVEQELTKFMQPFSFGADGFKKKMIYFVGPTGVGKTTTIAKIAAKAMLENGKKVALITMDTYRIGAIDQLKTYSKIMDVPLEVTYNLKDFLEAKKKFADFDIIFVDTAGRNYKQVEFIQQLSETIDYDKQTDDMYLVVSATTKFKELERTFQQFEPFSINKVIFTKMDEVSENGVLFNMVLRCKVGIAFLTNGQNVPDDLMEATPEKVTSMIVGEWNNE